MSANLLKSKPRTAPPAVPEHETVHYISPDRILANPAQPRRDFDSDAILRLADSIRRYGFIQPLSVRKIGTPETAGALYELIAGERRLRAARMLTLESVPCIILEANEQRSAELAIIENLQREDLNMFEEASAIARLLEIYHLTQEKIAQKLSTSQSYIANKLRLLKLTAAERERILRYRLTERHARALLKLPAPDDRLAAIEHIREHGLNVAATEEYVERMLAGEDAPPKPEGTRKLILRDMRIFYNSIDRAVSLMKQSGIDVATERVEHETHTELILSIPKK